MIGTHRGGLAPQPGSVRRLPAVLLAALAGVIALALPALAVEDQRVFAPRAGATLIGDTRIVASVTAAQGETVQSVQARFLRGGAEVGRRFSLGFAEGQPEAGESRWAATLAPLASPAADGAAMANGSYSLQVRATTSAGTGEWQGHDVVIDVLPPRTSVRANPTPEGVDVSWASVPLPDFRRYTLERALGDEGFSELITFTGADRTAHRDAAPAGPVRYRVVVGRAAANGGELTSLSEPVEVAVPAPAAPPADPAPSPAPAPPPPAQPPPAPDTGTDTASGFANPPPRPPADYAPSQLPAATSFALPPPLVTFAPPAPSEPPAPPPLDPAAPAAPADTVDAQAKAFDEKATDRAPVIEEDQEGSDLAVGGGQDFAVDQVLPPVAGGLVLLLGAAHVVRFRNG